MQNNAPWCLPHLTWGLYCAFLPGRDWLGAILLLSPGFNETSLIDISERSGKVYPWKGYKVLAWAFSQPCVDAGTHFPRVSTLLRPLLGPCDGCARLAV